MPIQINHSLYVTLWLTHKSLTFNSQQGNSQPLIVGSITNHTQFSEANQYLTDYAYNKEYMHYVVDSPNTTHTKHMRIHCECHFHTIYHIPYSIYHKPKWSHWPKHYEYFFKKTALADPIFTVGGGFNCFGQLLIQSSQWYH